MVSPSPSTNVSQKKHADRPFRLLFALGSQGFSTLYVAGVSLAITIFLGRWLGPEQFGLYQYLLTLAGFAAIVQEGGFSTLLFREGTAPSPHQPATTLLPSMALGHLIVSTSIFVLLALTLPMEQGTLMVTALMSAALIAWHRFVSGHLRGHSRFVTDALWQMSARTMTAIGMAFGAWLWPGELTMIFLGWGVAGLFILLLPIAKPLLCWPHWNPRTWTLQASMGLLTIDLATAIYFRSDLVMLEQMGIARADIGEYAAAYRLVEGVLLMVSPVGVLCLRSLRQRWQAHNSFSTLLTFLVAVSLSLATLTFGAGLLAGEWLLELLFGQPFQGAQTYLPWLLGMLFFALPNTILTQAAIASNREWRYAGIATGCALLNVALNFLWIPQHGPMGSAWASVVTEGGLMVGLILLMRRDFLLNLYK